jgi:hypothetical protein
VGRECESEKMGERGKVRERVRMRMRMRMRNENEKKSKENTMEIYT